MGLFNLLNAGNRLVGLTEKWGMKVLLVHAIPKLGGAAGGGAGLTGS